MKKIVYISIAMLMIACGGAEENTDGENETSSIINPPFEGDFQNDTIFNIDPTKENVVSTPNGSSIKIPANTLVDEDGNVVTEKVELTFIQYHSPADILASGIPMEYDSAGTVGTFQSAGMFQLNAASKGKEIFIKEGSQVSVDLASDTPEPYNFYNMDNQNGDWTYDFSPRTPVRSNPRFDPSKFPLEPQEASDDAFVLDLNFDLSDYNEISGLEGIVWEYVGDHDSLDPRQNSVVATTMWNNFELEPTYGAAFEYYLTFVKGDLTFTTMVRAALRGESFEKAMADYEQKKQEVADEIDYLQKPYIRNVEISGFGTFNYDIVHQMPDPTILAADFDFGEEYDHLLDKILVFAVYPGDNAVINYPKHNWNKFAVDPTLEVKIMAALPDNKFAYYDNDPHQAVGKKKFKFKMKVIDESLKSKADLENIMAKI